MRLAVISDIHGNLTALEAVLADFDALGGADQLWVLGDLAAFGPRPTECIRRIKALAEAAERDETRKGSFRAIRGNTDRYLLTGARPRSSGKVENADDLKALVETVRLRDQGLAWGMAQLAYEDYEFLGKLGWECDLRVEGYGYVVGYHGTPGDDEGILAPETTDEQAADSLLDREGRLGIGGHIHKQMDRELNLGGWRAINVGSVGLSFDQPGMAQWGMFTFTDGQVKVDLRAVPYDVEAVIADLHAVGYPEPTWPISKLKPPKADAHA